VAGVTITHSPKNAPFFCESHEANEIMCSCGFIRDEIPRATFPRINSTLKWNRKKIQKEWKSWDDRQRQIYLDYRVLALECGASRILAARFAAQKVYEKGKVWWAIFTQNIDALKRYFPKSMKPIYRQQEQEKLSFMEAERKDDSYGDFETIG
jgi:hypothetical protein